MSKHNCQAYIHDSASNCLLLGATHRSHPLEDWPPSMQTCLSSCTAALRPVDSLLKTISAGSTGAGADPDSAPFTYQWGTPAAVSNGLPDRSYPFTINHRTACCVDLSSCQDCNGTRGRVVGFCDLDGNGRVSKARYSWLGLQQQADNDSAWILYMTPSGQLLCLQPFASFCKALRPFADKE